MTQSADSWRHDSYLSGGNADYLDQQYELFLNNPAAVPEELRNYFSQWPRAGVAQHASIQKRFRNDALRGEVHAAATSTESSKQAAVDACCALHIHGMARVDFFYDKNSDRLYVNEVNAIPGFCDISLYPQMWKASGINYKDLLDRLIAAAKARFEKRQHLLVLDES